jgi:hypothetical protein
MRKLAGVNEIDVTGRADIDVARQVVALWASRGRPGA